MLYTYHLTTPVSGFVSITAQVKGAVAESGVQSGICVVYCPHTTAGITINENADPDVQRDLLLAYAEAFPDRKAFRHAEGSSRKGGCHGQQCHDYHRTRKASAGHVARHLFLRV